MQMKLDFSTPKKAKYEKEDSDKENSEMSPPVKRLKVRVKFLSDFWLMNNESLYCKIAFYFLKSDFYDGF